MLKTASWIGFFGIVASLLLINAFLLEDRGLVSAESQNSIQLQSGQITRTPSPTPTIDPALVVEDISIDDVFIETASTCGALGTRVWIANNGNVDTGEFLISVNGNWYVVTNVWAGQSIQYWTPGYVNGKTIVELDVTDVIAEQDEDNNTFQGILPIPTPEFCPTPTGTLTATPPATATRGNNFTIPTRTPTPDPNATATPTGANILLPIVIDEE